MPERKKKTGKCQPPNWDKKFHLHLYHTGIYKGRIFFSEFLHGTNVSAFWLIGLSLHLGHCMLFDGQVLWIMSKLNSLD